MKDVGEFSSSGLAKGGVGAGEQIGAILPEDLTAEVAGGRGWSEAGEGEGGGGDDSEGEGGFEADEDAAASESACSFTLEPAADEEAGPSPSPSPTSQALRTSLP